MARELKTHLNKRVTVLGLGTVSKVWTKDMKNWKSEDDRDYANHSIIRVDQSSKISPEDLQRFAVILPPMNEH